MEAKEAKDNARQEIETNTDFTKLNDFLNAMFPFENEADLVYDELLKNGTYDAKTKSWEGEVPDTADESSYSPWFAGIAEKMVAAYLKVFNVKDEERTFLTKWVARPNNPPVTLSDVASLVRPDIINVVQSWEEYTLLKNSHALQEEIEEKGSAMKKSRRNTSKQAADKNEPLKSLSNWWSRINVMVEVKQAKSTLLEHIERLAGYLQHVLHEQLDRRSAFGLLFCKNELAAWHADRSGILGTDEAFDVHAHPRMFIQVILGCSVGKPSMLGYDPSMRLWLPSNKMALPSYHPDVTPRDFQRSNSEKNWLISMPGGHDMTLERKSFLTINAVSTHRANNISGRATVVWVAMDYEDRGKKDHKVYVLKQCWRPIEATAEGDLIPKGVANITKVHSFEDVLDEMGKKITTVEYLRHNQTHTPPTPRHDPKEIANRVAQADRIEASETKAIVLALGGDLVTIPRHAPISRIQGRLVMEDYGWPILHFRDLNELLKVFKEVVTAQKEMYFNHHTLQRDISIGNILIVPSDGGKSLDPTHAYLIDYDYAKRAEFTSRSTLGLLEAIKGQWPSEERLQSRRADVQDDHGIDIDPKLGRLLSVYLHQAYLSDLKLLLSAKGPIGLSTVGLGLLRKDDILPDFRRITSQSCERSATIPFASCEILSGRKMTWSTLNRPLSTHESRQDLIKYISNSKKNTVVYHDAVHDVEPLFWLLTFICITRSGPGGRRRKELQEVPNGESTAKMHALCTRLFVQTTLADMANDKEAILMLDRVEEVTDHFTDYFQPLKGMWVQWKEIIRFAHNQPIFERIHDFILAAIDDAIEEVKSLPEARPEDVLEVDKKRKEQLDFFRNFLADPNYDPRKPHPDIPSYELTPEKYKHYTQADDSEDSDLEGEPLAKKLFRGEP